jgi:hypothetical protein
MPSKLEIGSKFKLDEKITPKTAFARGASKVFVTKDGKTKILSKSSRSKYLTSRGKVWGYGIDHRTYEIDVSIDVKSKKK